MDKKLNQPFQRGTVVMLKSEEWNDNRTLFTVSSEGTNVKIDLVYILDGIIYEVESMDYRLFKEYTPPSND